MGVRDPPTVTMGRKNVDVFVKVECLPFRRRTPDLGVGPSPWDVGTKGDEGRTEGCDPRRRNETTLVYHVPDLLNGVR